MYSGVYTAASPTDGVSVFTGWALRNTVGASEAGPVSYYARVRGRPEALLWMPYTEEDDAQATLRALD